MPLFSQRKGIKPPKTVAQVESMDADLRIGLWNILTAYFFDKIRGELIYKIPPMHRLLNSIWHSYFKIPLDTLDDWGAKPYAKIRDYFFKAEWNEVYDFVEFVANTYQSETDPKRSYNQDFMKSCNDILERELSAYRFVGGMITQITSKEEITEVEEALKLMRPLAPISNHLLRALELLANKKSPDYRNSIKESISAVEAICRLITSDKSASLGAALDLIEKQGQVKLHPALKSAFDKLYGYTSAAEGIRHALLDETSLQFDDAKFMLVSCSAFVNYLISKASRAGIRL